MTKKQPMDGNVDAVLTAFFSPPLNLTHPSFLKVYIYMQIYQHPNRCNSSLQRKYLETCLYQEHIILFVCG